jgi:predicted transcriptional regulator
VALFDGACAMVNMINGYVRKGIALLLLDEGQATRIQLMERIDVQEHSLNAALKVMQKLELIARQKIDIRDSAAGGGYFYYGLTRLGIDEAMKLDPKDLKDCERTA